MGTGGQLKMFFVKSSFLCKIPGCSESESDIGNNIKGIPSDTLGISNWKTNILRISRKCGNWLP